MSFGAMDVTKPHEFTHFGAMDVTKTYKFIRPREEGAVDGPSGARAATATPDKQLDFRELE
jgi:hypothetical protein